MSHKIIPSQKKLESILRYNLEYILRHNKEINMSTYTAQEEKVILRSDNFNICVATVSGEVRDKSAAAIQIVDALNSKHKPHAEGFAEGFGVTLGMALGMIVPVLILSEIPVLVKNGLLGLGIFIGLACAGALIEARFNTKRDSAPKEGEAPTSPLSDARPQNPASEKAPN